MEMNPQDILNKRREQFLDTRLRIETKVNDYMERVIELRAEEPNLFDGINFPNGGNAKELLPAMYEDPFDPDAYKSQRESLLLFARQCDEVAKRVNEEAIQCLLT